MTQVKLLVLILFAFLVAVFAVSNPQTASVQMFGKTIFPEVSMVVIVLGSILVGVLITAFLGFLLQAKLKKQISKLSKENKQFVDKEEKLQLKIRSLEEDLEKSEVIVPSSKPGE